MGETASTEAAERHASWIELFFDLVAVAGVASLSHLLIGELSWDALGLYVLLFIAFWQTWAAFMVFGDVGGDTVRLIQVLVGMFGIGAMSAAIPQASHWVLASPHESAARGGAQLFAVAYFFTRTSASGAIGNKLVIDFPIVQRTFGAVPWLVSVFVHDVRAVVVLWTLGIAIDLLGMLFISGERMREEIDRRYEQQAIRVNAAGVADHPRMQQRMERFRVTAVSLSGEHFAERLGLLVIIVLGEGVVQVVDASAELPIAWSTGFAAALCFGLLAALFALSLLAGSAGLPLADVDALPARATLALHALTTGVITALAVGLAHAMELRHEPAPDAIRWLLCGSVALYLAIALLARLVAGPGDGTGDGTGVGTRTPTWPLAVATLAPVVVGLLGDDLRATRLVALLLVILLVVASRSLPRR